MVRVYFENLDRYSKQTEVIAAYSRDIKGILNIVLDRRDN